MELHGLEGDERGDDVVDGPAIESFQPELREMKLEESLKGVKKNAGRVGLFKVSHIGGHRYVRSAPDLQLSLTIPSCVQLRRQRHCLLP